MSIEIVGTARLRTEPWMAPLALRHTLHRITPKDDPLAVLPAGRDHIRVMVSGGGFDVGPDFLDLLPALGMIAVTGAGWDRIDVAAARARGIQICNAPGTTDRCVADMAIGLLLAAARRIVVNDRFVREGRWLKGRSPLTRRASGRRLGIYGLGGIGLQVAQRAVGFDMEVHYHNRRERPDVPYRYHASLVALADAVDDLIVSCPATAETSGSVDAEVLAALGSDGVLVNVARGSVVDEPALIRALEGGTIKAAGLDVFPNEPEVTPALLALDNVVLSPHTAGSTQGTWDEVVLAVLDNIETFLATGRVRTPIPQN